MNFSKTLSLLIASLLAFSCFAEIEKEIKVYDGTNFDEVVCRFYALKDFSKIPYMNYTSHTEYRQNNKIKAYDMLAQIYRSADSNFKYSISSGFLKGESKVMDRKSIPKVFSIFNQLQRGTLTISEDAEGAILNWQIEYSSIYAQLISLSAVGPLCKEILSEDKRELTLDILTSSFYEAANPKAIPGVKVTE